MDIKLFIGDMPVDLNDEIQILFNWTDTDLSNPTNYKNGYSKTITLEGTNNNNELFGHFWDLERYQLYGGDNRSNFNPSYRVPFILYHNGSIYERGYVKLEKVITENEVNKYEISLFGGLGSFLYNLSVDWSSGNKKTLGDLDYVSDKLPTTATSFSDLSFTINKGTVKNAWDAINTTDVKNKYYHLNFAPTYRGLPDNLNTDKVVINFSGMTYLTDSYSGYTTYNGYALGKLPSNLTEEEVKDYRSYLQTPVIRVKSIIDAICKSENNKGKYDEGYEVELDPDFFNDKNPYYSKSWMTLNNISISPIEASDIVTNYSNLKVHTQYGDSANTTFVFYLGPHNAGRMKISFDLDITVPEATSSDKRLWLASMDTRPAIENTCINAVAIQAYASNSVGTSENILASSKISWNTNSIRQGTTNRFYYDGQYAKKAGYYTPIQDRDIVSSDGSFIRQDNGKYRWYRKIEIECDQPEDARYLKINIQAVDKAKPSRRNKLSTNRYLNGDYNLYDWSVGNVEFSSKLLALEEKDSSNFYSNKHITQSQLLATSFSPAEFLVSYCKMFGLYIYKDLTEDKVYIKTRNNFFKRDNIIDIDDKIDISQSVEIKPIYSESNFYSMSNNGEKSKNEDEYTEKYSKVFGQKIIETGNEFNADTTELVNSVLKGAVQTKEQSVYFFKKEENNPYVYNGFSYSLYKKGLYDEEAYTEEIPKKNIFLSFNPFNMDEYYYDSVGKIQLRDKSNKGVSSEGVLLFFNGFEDVSGYGYYMTDDLPVMSTLNNNPCWLMTNSEYDTMGNEIAIELNSIPKFSRYYEGNKYMVYSMDYGSARQLYIPNFSINDNANIYHNYFENYFNDLYDINTKVIKCYIHTEYLLNEDYLRNIYWFRNGLWRLNKIIDYNPDSENSTLCEFIKIQDLDNLSNYNPTTDRWIKITLDRYDIGQGGGTIIGTVITSDNYGWDIDSITYDKASPLPRGVVTVTPETYGQNGNFTLSVPSNIRDAREVTINVKSDYNGQNVSGSTSFTQPGVEYNFSLSPTSLTGSTLENSKTFNITNPYFYDWTIESKPNWVTVSPSSIINGQYGETGNTTATVTAAKNTTEVERRGTITLKETTYNHSYTVSIWQDGYKFSVPSTQLNFAKNGESKTISISNPYGYSWKVQSKPDWISVVPSSDTRGTSLTISASKNIVFERSGNITIYESDFGHTYTIPIVQESGYVFSIEPKSFYFHCYSGLKDTLTINNPNQMAWTITNIPAWVTISPTAGTGASVSISVDKNIGFERSGLSITVNETLCDQHYTFDVTQESGYIFEISQNKLSFDGGGCEDKTITINNPNGLDWEIVALDSWLSASPSRGNSSATITFSAQPNSGKVRTDSFSIVEKTFSQIYNIEATQTGYTFSISPTSFTYEDTVQTQYLDVIKPVCMAWAISNLPSWLSASPTSGTDSRIALTTAENQGFERSQSVTVTDSYSGAEYKFNVVQESGYEFRLLPTTGISFTSENTSKIMTISCKDYHWQITSKPSWLVASPMTGYGPTNVYLTPTKNIGYARSGVVKVKDTDYNLEYTLNVSQESGYVFNVSPLSYSFNSAGTSQQMTITNPNNLNWKIYNLANWMSASPNSGNGSATVTLSASANGREVRTDYFEVEEETIGNTFDCVATQASGYSFSVSKINLDYDVRSSSQTFTINNPFGYAWTITNIPSWMTLSATAGSASATITVTVNSNDSSENERSQTIYINENDYGKRYGILVKQEGYVFYVAPDSLSFASAGTTSQLTKYFGVTDESNLGWEIVDDPNWVTVSPRTGIGDTTIAVAARGNSGNPSRSGGFTVKEKTFNRTYRVSLSQQSGYVFNASPIEFSYNSSGGSHTMSINNPYNYSWEIRTLPDWITASTTAGTSSANVTFTASANGYDERESAGCTLAELTHNNYTDLYFVQASGFTFGYSPSGFDFSCKSGSKTLTINNPFGYYWTITNIPNWLDVNPTAGTGTSATLTVQGNNSSSNREQNISLNDITHSMSYTINVEQYAKEFSVSPTSFSFASAGESKYLNIYDKDNLGWEITDSPSWVTISPISGVGFTGVTITAKKNTSGQRSGTFKVTEKTFGGATTVSLSQESGYVFGVSPTSFTGLNRTGGSVTMTINNPNGYSWEIKNIPDWITASTTAGTSSTNVTFTYAANTYNNPREARGMGVFDATHSNYIDLYFEQEALLTPSITSITATVNDNPEPPEPSYTWKIVTNNTSGSVEGALNIKNGMAMNIRVVGSSTGYAEKTYSDSLPFTITGAELGKTTSSGSSTSGTITLKNNSGTIVCRYDSSANAFRGTGSITIDTSNPELNISW